MALEGAEERLELSHADLLHYHSLARAFSGCVGVFHTCQPLNLEEFTAYPVSTVAGQDLSPGRRTSRYLVPGQQSQNASWILSCEVMNSLNYKSVAGMRSKRA